MLVPEPRMLKRMTIPCCYGTINGRMAEPRILANTLTGTVASEDHSHMLSALGEARAAAMRGEVPVGAVLTVDGSIVARAHNRRETLQDPTAHAEMIVLREGAAGLGTWRLIGATLYVTLGTCALCIGAALPA